MVFKRKISLIGILMAASWLLLCLFIAQWIGSQYMEQKKQLRQEINLTLQQINNRISDSIANVVLQEMLANGHTPTRVKADIQLSSVNEAGTAKLPQTLAAQPPFQKTIVIPSDSVVSGSGNRNPSGSFKFDNLLDSQKVRLILNGILKSLIFLDTGSHASHTRLSGKVYSGLYRHAVKKALQEKHLVLRDSSEILNHSDSDFVFMLASNDMLFPVGGTQAYILKKLVPQIAFSTTLLLLVGLAFLMSYLNLRKQLRFNKQKDTFIANISHELKTPVTTAKVAMEALQKHDALQHPERAGRYLDIAGWELDRLQTMMEKIMNSLPENEKEIVVQPTKLAIRPILLRLAEIIQSTQKEKIVTFVWTLPETPVHLRADELHFTNIIYNLLDNAVKYGGTEIKISVNEDTDYATIKISDNGSGIPTAYRNKVFDRFFRVPSGNRHNVKGYGLGLSYVRQMVAAHQGSIHLAAGAETCFIIKWPKFKR